MTTHRTVDISRKTKELNPATGLLELKGTLDLKQFWPDGTSDADTANVAIDLAAGPFQFRENLAANSKKTNVFDAAWIHGKTTVQAIRHNKQGATHVTILLQGIDAPELHYQPTEKGTKDFRQILGETCTVKLAEFLNTIGPEVVDCSVVTAVNHPNDVFDTYGRLIGDILIHHQGQTVNVNHWLVEHGWAFPTFYDSMTAQEIAAYEQLLPKAKQNGSGVYAHLTGDIADLDWGLLFKSHGPAQAEPGGRNTIMPKIFRRLAAWSVKKKNGSTQDSFIDYVQKLPKNQNQCFPIEDLKAKHRNLVSLSQFIKANNLNGHFEKDPEQLVFIEAPSQIYDQKVGGDEITKWW